MGLLDFLIFLFQSHTINCKGLDGQTHIAGGLRPYTFNSYNKGWGGMNKASTETG